MGDSNSIRSLKMMDVKLLQQADFSALHSPNYEFFS